LVTKTSPCSAGFMVPASVLRYGSHFWIFTEKPRALRMVPKDAAVMPLPSPERTPPVTKMNLVWPDFANTAPSCLVNSPTQSSNPAPRLVGSWIDVLGNLVVWYMLSTRSASGIFDYPLVAQGR